MDKKILIDAVYPDNIQAAVVENNKLEEIEYTSTAKKLIKGNIYLAKVTRIEPALQAAFIDYGDEKNGFIPFSEIHTDYYNVPCKYRKSVENSSQTEVASGKLEKSCKRKKGKKEEHNLAQDEALDAEDSYDENYMEEVKQKNVEKYKIQEVLKRNQILLVQAVKEVRGNKGAMFTTYISLAGKYCVVMPNCISKGGISRRITNIEVRKKLQKVFDEVSKNAQLSFIIRTAGQGHTKEEIKKDYSYLINLWNNIREKTLSAIAPAFIYDEDNVLKKVIRDLYDKDTKEIIVQGEEAHKDILEIIKLMNLMKYVRVNKYNEKIPIFSKFKIAEEFASLYSPIIDLKSGAYIVINKTEALIAIDVNSGKSTSERNVEETAIKTNVEAAKEIARQLRLRELSGLIVIDFIDMLDSRNKAFVERAFRDFLRKDRARIQMGHISNFGLLEMSRQFLKPSFLELNTVMCPQCKGKGVIKSDATNVIAIFKTIDTEIMENKNIKTLKVYLSPQTALFILNHRRKEIKAFEDKYKISIFILQDQSMRLDSFAIETVEKEKIQQKIISNHANKDSVAGENKTGSLVKDFTKNTETQIKEKKENSSFKISKRGGLKNNQKKKTVANKKNENKAVKRPNAKVENLTEKKKEDKSNVNLKAPAEKKKEKAKKTSKVKNLLNKLLG